MAIKPARATLFALAALISLPITASADPQQTIDAAFALQFEGATLTEVRAELAKHAGDDAIDFALGATDFLIAGERLTQQAHRLGFMGPLRAAAPWTGPRARFFEWFANSNPDNATAKDVHDAIERFAEDLAIAEKTLQAAEADFKCVIDITAIRFDIDSDSKATPAESLHALFALLPDRSVRNPDTRQWERVPLVPEQVIVAFDTGDARWLRGYCHVLMAAADWALAHDGRELFDHTGHIFFPKAKIKYDYLPNSTFTLETLFDGRMQTPTPFDVTDVIVFFGNMRLPVDEPERMKSTLHHLRAAVDLGKQMWSLYDKEQDDDREWIPNPTQTAAFADVQIDQDMRDAWLLFLDEADDVLAGKKVLRFWRGDGTKGIDVPKLFNEPREFDLLYWIQGSAAAPYLREGEFTSPGTWAQLERALNNRVFRYAFWFN